MTNTAPRFAVIAHIPTHDDRDCIAFWTLRTLATTMTKGWAFKLRDQHDDEGVSETTIEVRDLRTGKRVVREWWRVTWTDDLPF